MFATHIVPSITVLPLVTQPQPTDIPGMGGLNTIVGWIIGLAYLALVVAFIIAAVKLAYAHKHGEASEAGKNIVMILAAGVFISSAAAIINAVI
jgi:hypothetical protein